jgi:hypothetical protein
VSNPNILREVKNKHVCPNIGGCRIRIGIVRGSRLMPQTKKVLEIRLGQTKDIAALAGDDL